MNTPQKIKRYSAGVVLIYLPASECRYLVLRAYRNWDFPKGLVEMDESPLEAAIRETYEETSIANLNFRWGYNYCDTKPYAGGKIARYFLAETNSMNVVLPVNPILGKPEHHEYRWVRYETARKLLPERLIPIIEWANHELIK